MKYFMIVPFMPFLILSVWAPKITLFAPQEGFCDLGMEPLVIQSNLQEHLLASSQSWIVDTGCILWLHSTCS